jgi:hypothetical protein
MIFVLNLFAKGSKMQVGCVQKLVLNINSQLCFAPYMFGKT